MRVNGVVSERCSFRSEGFPGYILEYLEVRHEISLFSCAVLTHCPVTSEFVYATDRKSWSPLGGALVILLVCECLFPPLLAIFFSRRLYDV